MAAVVSSVAKVVAAGGDYKKVYLTLQEFFEKLRDDPERWGKPFAALLGALEAQLGPGCAAIGGKDSMSGSFLDLDVPPTLISFAIAPVRAGEVISSEFKQAGHPVYGSAAPSPTASRPQGGLGAVPPAVPGGQGVRRPGGGAGRRCRGRDEHGLRQRHRLCRRPPGGRPLVRARPGHDCGRAHRGAGGRPAAGYTTEKAEIAIGKDVESVADMLRLNEAVLEDVYPTRTEESGKVRAVSFDTRSPAVCKSPVAKPGWSSPSSPGTNCEYDSARACLRAGLEPEIVVVRNPHRRRPGGVRPGPGEGHSGQPDHLPARRLLRGRRARRVGQVHLLLLPQQPPHRRGARPAEKPGRADAGHLQRLPGPHQAGPGALRRDPGHGRGLPHPDLQHHRPPPEPVRHHPGGLGSLPLDAQEPGWGISTPSPSPTARAASWPPRRW